MTPLPLWHFSKNSSDLVELPFPKQNSTLGSVVPLAMLYSYHAHSHLEYKMGITRNAADIEDILWARRHTGICKSGVLLYKTRPNKNVYFQLICYKKKGVKWKLVLRIKTVIFRAVLGLLSAKIFVGIIINYHQLIILAINRTRSTAKTSPKLVLIVALVVYYCLCLCLC